MPQMAHFHAQPNEKVKFARVNALEVKNDHL